MAIAYSLASIFAESGGGWVGSLGTMIALGSSLFSFQLFAPLSMAYNTELFPTRWRVRGCF